MKFYFKIYMYTDGNGMYVCRAKRKGRFGLYWWVTNHDVCPIIYIDSPATYESADPKIAREKCMDQLKCYSARLASELKKEDYDAKRDKLTLVFVEKETISI